MRTIYIKSKRKNETVISYLKSIFPNMITSTLYKALRNKDIRLNNVKINIDCCVKYNDKLDIYISDIYLFNLPKNLTTIYEDDNILAVYKPQGILSNIEKFDEENMKRIGGLEPTLETIVCKVNSNYKICHRLDRNTAGVVIFSKNEIAYLEMLKAFKEGYIHKEYIAYVANSNFEKEHDILEKYILKQKDSFSKIYDKKVANSKKIITEYYVLQKNIDDDFAILKVIIHTGKTHQIRAQLANISHPIIGDPKYGKNEINKKFKIYKQLLFAVKYSFSFYKDSPLSYLNNISISLDENLYNNMIR
ncbi:MAG: RluA family pseudouridine synthase [Clostridia bacterium]|nr:RluA family pseudouridine synthase [Clostridia bacterium]